jgi:hypothetical protein
MFSGQERTVSSFNINAITTISKIKNAITVLSKAHIEKTNNYSPNKGTTHIYKRDLTVHT